MHHQHITKHWQLSPNLTEDRLNGIEDIEQAIRNILTTPKGSTPLRPLFGCGLFDHLDKPLDDVAVHLVLDISQALKNFEPRINVKKVVPHIQDTTVTITIDWVLAPNVANDLLLYTTEITLER